MPRIPEVSVESTFDGDNFGNFATFDFRGLQSRLLCLETRYASVAASRNIQHLLRRNCKAIAFAIVTGSGGLRERSNNHNAQAPEIKSHVALGSGTRTTSWSRK